MTIRSRYTLLFAGLLTFIITAPTLLWYVQGKRLPFGSTDRTGGTGLISAETDPSNAAVWLNGDKRATTPGAVRFLDTGRYTVEIRKEGYRTWQKTLSVIAGRVTHANPNPVPLKLLRDELPEVLAQQVSAVATDGSLLLYSTASGTLVVTPSDGELKTLTLPGPANRITPLPSLRAFAVRGHNYTWVVQSADLTHAALPPLSADADIQSIGATIFTLSDGQLTRAHRATPTETETLARNVRSFATHGSELYYLAPDNANLLVLHHSTVEDTALVRSQTLATGISDGPARLFVDEQKAVYVWQGQTVYRVGGQADAIAQNVTDASVRTGALVYTTAGELWWYDARSLRPNLVSRTSQPFHTYLVSPASQYGIYTDTDGLIATELNTEAGQNRYVLDPNASNTSELAFQNDRFLIFLSGTTLKRLQLF